MSRIVTLIFVIAALTVSAQNRAIGTWTAYMPYTVSKSMCDAGNVIYCAAQQTVFSYDKTSKALRTYDKSNGLSDVGIKTINYDPNTKFLVIAYVDNNIDLIYNGTDIYNISDIETEAATSGNGGISINSISFYNGFAYLSTSIGISVIDLKQLVISDTYIIGSTGSPVNVNSTAFDSVNIYAATPQGLKYAPLSSPNLSDFNNWFLFGNQPFTLRTSWVTEYNNNLYAVANIAGGDTLYKYNGAGWTKIFSSSFDSIVGINIDNNSLYLSVWYDSTGYSGALVKLDASGNVTLTTPPGPQPLNWFESNGSLWVADYFTGMFNVVNGSKQAIQPEGPFSSNVYRMAIHNGILDVAPGGVDESWGNDYNQDGFFIYQNSQWTYQDLYSNSVLAPVFDIMCTAAVDATGKTYFGSFYSGLIEMDDQTQALTVYDQYNTNGFLEPTIGDNQRTKISCLYTDAYNNLWIGDAGATKPIKVIESDGTRAAFGLSNNAPNFQLIKNMFFDDNNQLWAPLRAPNAGLLVWSYNNTLNDPSDDVSTVLYTGQGLGGLPNSNCYCVAEDLDGNIWVGTDAGIGIYYCAANVLQTGGCDAEQIKVVGSDGYVAYLFGSESVRAIAVDAANRKWVGTTNGVWLISADGQTQLLSFNSSNSPMPANQVTDIQIDNNTGEVYIGTVGGLVSYRGDALGTCQDCSKALVYPNPVKPDYKGPIAIRGLAENANVKITDVSGILVYQGNANGQQMIWSGYNYNGVRAKSGVYLVYSADDLGKERKVAKILIMN